MNRNRVLWAIGSSIAGTCFAGLAAQAAIHLDFSRMYERHAPPPEMRIDRPQPYHQGGGVTRQQVSQMQYYAKQQPMPAMRKMLGAPNYTSSTTEVYTVRGTSDGVTSDRRLIVRYRPDSDCNYECSKAYDWYTQ
jgi:hypothetical protein